MPLTLGLTGMDPATEAALKAAFADANARLHGAWRLTPEAEAEHVVVDMDSMYGPMSWLRLHAAGKHVIGLTSAPRTQTDFRLGRPFNSAQVEQLLRDIGQHEGVGLPASAASVPRPAQDAPAAPVADAAREAADPASPADAEVSAEVGTDAVEAGVPPGPAPKASDLSPAPVPQDQLPKESLGNDRDAAPQPAFEPSPTHPVPTHPEPPPRDPIFADWLMPGALTRRVRYRRASGPTLLIDPINQVWHGPTPLKPVAAYFQGKVAAEDFESLNDAHWMADSATAGPPQPLSRLHWLGGLVAGHGTLLPGLDPDGRYVLDKWPQTEREYPKHFRIATAMMKGPATVAEIAEASSMPAGEVADFINANLATGYAAHVPEPEPEPEVTTKPGGLFGRLRNR